LRVMSCTSLDSFRSNFGGSAGSQRTGG
jgi:hypothetical protein